MLTLRSCVSRTAAAPRCVFPVPLAPVIRRTPSLFSRLENSTTFLKHFFSHSFLHSKLKKEHPANLGGTPLELLLFQFLMLLRFAAIFSRKLFRSYSKISFCRPSSLSSGEYPHFSNANLSSVSKRFNSSIKFYSLMLYSACCKSLKGPNGTRKAGSPKSLQTLHHSQIPERPWAAFRFL